jgi:hypothetical protein
LKEIECGVFAVCHSLEQIVIPDSVEEIRDGALRTFRPIHIELSMKSLSNFDVCQALARILGGSSDLVPGTTVLIRDGGELSKWRVNEEKQFELINQ